MKSVVDIKKIIFAVIVIIGLSQVVRIYGMSEYNIAIADAIMHVVVVCIIAVIAWYVYGIVLVHLINWFDDSVESGEESGLYPLFAIIGKLVIIVASIWYIMAYLGIDLLVILTSIGVVGLAITFGAQSTLSQFFSGLNLLMARPFKAGDVIRMNGDTTTYQVRKVRLMNTVLEEWDTKEPYIIPNNTIAGATINNVTGERRAFCASIFMDIHFKSDLDKAKELMLKAALETEHIILDGSRPYPEVTFVALGASTLKAKLAAYGDDFNINDAIISDLMENIAKELRDHDVGYAPPTRYDVHMVD